MFQFLSLLVICMVAGFLFWLWRSFRSLHPALIVFNLSVGLGGNLTANRRLWRSFRNGCIRRPLVVASLATALIWILSDGPAQARWRALLTETLARPTVWIGTLVVLLATGVLVLLRREAVDVGHGRRPPDQVCVDGAVVTITPVRPRNLIIIQMESLEATFSRADLFGRDLLAPLMALPGHSFAALQPSRGASWTTSSMMTTLLGVPFRARLALGRRALRPRGGAFRPELTGFTDILKRHGYTSVALQGATATFHGFRDLFSLHGFDRAIGSEELVPRGVSGLSSWGVFDDDLFDAAREEIARLRASEGPFCMYIVTSDTHAPRGEASIRLRRTHETRSLADIIAYNAEIAARFVEDLSASGGLADTHVAIIGDHLMPATAVLPELRCAKDRTIFNRFVAIYPPSPDRAVIEQTDLAATLLEFAGFAIDGGRLGLGRSGFRVDRAAAEQARPSEVVVPSSSSAVALASATDQP